MTTFRKFCVALFVLTIALNATGQEHPTGTPAKPTADASMPHDCDKSLRRHDHTAEKGMPTPKSIIDPCTPSVATSAPKAKVKPKHDHAQFHKNQ